MPGVLNKLNDWLTVSDPCQKSDVIFVLAGREYRKRFALRLLQENWAPILLISVGRFELRRFSNLKVPASPDLPVLAAATEPPLRHYFVTIRTGNTETRRITVRRFGTLSEIKAFAEWLREHPSIRSAIVVSSGFHLKRVRMCCHHLVPEGTTLHFVAAPEEGQPALGSWRWDSDGRSLILPEVAKVAMYRLLCQNVIARARCLSNLTRRGTRAGGARLEESI